jgi:DNA-binding response OmpR family regulator
LIVGRDDALAERLRLDGHRVHVVDTAAAALAHGAANVPDAVLLAAALPDGDGYALAKVFRKDILNARCAILVVSTQEEARQGDHGVVDLHLTKPLETHLLSDLLHYVLDRRRHHRIVT